MVSALAVPQCGQVMIDSRIMVPHSIEPMISTAFASRAVSPSAPRTTATSGATERDHRNYNAWCEEGAVAHRDQPFGTDG
jgi:hypothetical protein